MKTNLGRISGPIRVGVRLLSALAISAGCAWAQGLVWNFEYQGGDPVTLVWQSQAERIPEK